MDFNNICRTCLSPNNLNPIFTNVIDNANNLDIIYAATGVMVSTYTLYNNKKKKQLIHFYLHLY